MSEIKENLARVRENIAVAAEKSGRSRNDVTLVAVTKTVPIERINELASLGVADFGENKAQELVSKYGNIHPEPNWHMIGHLQTNKVKYVVERAALIQSVEGYELAEEINKRSMKINKITNILIEINIAGENTKFGLEPAKTEDFIEQMCNLSNICVTGLMCIAPFCKNPDENKVFFEKMFKIYVDIKKKFSHNTDIKILSMGMTNDYVAAIEEGANMVRIGTAIFGNRTG